MEDIEKAFETRELSISMGPQHPATHGVLRLVLNLQGENVMKCTPYVGYLHRGVEKLGENRTYLAALPLSDRLDYISSMNNNVGYVNAVKNLFYFDGPHRALHSFPMRPSSGLFSILFCFLFSCRSEKQ